MTTAAATYTLSQADLCIVADALSEYARTIRDRGDEAFSWNAVERIERCRELDEVFLSCDAVTVQGGSGVPASPNVAKTRYRPTSPDLYVPDSLIRLREKAANAIEKEIRTRNLTSLEIAHHMPSIRKADINRYLQGFGALFAEKKQFQVAEAIGLRFELNIKGAS